MAFDAIKKMAESVPDYLEVPVTEDGLLEKATAAIHALGYDMEEAISIFLRRIVQSEAAANPAQAEEYVRRTADTTLDDMVTQPLLVPRRDVFSVDLLDTQHPDSVPIGSPTSVRLKISQHSAWLCIRMKSANRKT